MLNRLLKRNDAELGDLCGHGIGAMKPDLYCSTIKPRREGFPEKFLHLKSHVVCDTIRARIANAKMIQVRHRSYATYSRQPRQVRKEATVTGSCACSEFPVPDLFSRFSRAGGADLP